MNKYDITLSYITSTRNRLPFLKITLEKLISELSADEEIVVVDGNSSDGTKEYLQKLLVENKIHQFISEADKNQAHGWNKAMLIARGEIIKKIIDDDVFCYDAIRECKQYMLNNSHIDVCISNDMSYSLGLALDTISFNSRVKEFEKWQRGEIKSFTFGDVHMLIRKKSLALIGLYDTSFTMMDWEYSLRISYSKAKIAYYTGFNALNVSHPNNVSSNVNINRLKLESQRACPMYEYNGDQSEISLWSKIKIFLGKNLKRKSVDKQKKNLNPNPIDISQQYPNLYIYLNESFNENKLNYHFLL